MAARHLLSLGRTRIAFLGEATEDCPEFRQRFEGYRRALKSAGLPARSELHLDADNQETSGFEAMQEEYETEDWALDCQEILNAHTDLPCSPLERVWRGGVKRKP